MSMCPDTTSIIARASATQPAGLGDIWGSISFSERWDDRLTDSLVRWFQ